MSILRYILAISLVLLISGIGWATDGSITSSSGMIMFNTADNQNWRPVYTGMAIGSGMNVKVSENSTVEVSIGNVTLRLNRACVYPMDPLLANPSNARETLINILSNALLETNNRAITSVAGVRASDAAATDTADLLLLDDTFGAGNPLEDAYFFLEENPPDYQGAIISLTSNSAISTLTSDKQGEAYFILGWSYYQTNQYNEAVGALNSALSASLNDELLGKSLVFKALSYKKIGNYEESITVGEAILNNSALSNFNEEALTILATSYLMIGDEIKANSYFEQLDNSSYFDVE